MGVYIKGMEMPKSCWDCPMVSGYEIADEARTICSTVRCRLTNTKRPAGEAIAPDCPLVPVQPHGRLIDADANIAVMMRVLNAPYTDHGIIETAMIKACIKMFEEAPTVIEAEEGET